ncbi:cadherin-like beta sandwich domain-containing protein [Ammoniphilus sp. CFH 90114]|uniref:cadherin-like beta sandwich domain-containing protein n=1 Tax=Ammoniphilus sp. CFH 90114 TaxID=2493665 RepID=UPI00100ECF62|nr:cadherin-like beta sandwich domain-containing protein [Ammoniphilus sp. CFH 90114]RXT03689.1 hypothetical protein EIZ39_23470 [Ammoniphilus sp. CFH 90114]
MIDKLLYPGYKRIFCVLLLLFSNLLFGLSPMVVSATGLDIADKIFTINTTNITQGIGLPGGKLALVHGDDLEIYSAEGEKVSTIANLSSYRSPKASGGADQFRLKVLNDGNLLIHWYSSSINQAIKDAYFTIISQDGQVVKAPTMINSDAGSLNRFTAAAQLSNGDLAFVWATSGTNYALRIFDSGGTARGNQLSIVNDSMGVYDIDIAANDNGTFMVVYNRYTAGQYKGILFHNNGGVKKSEFSISDVYKSGAAQNYVASLANGNFLVAYKAEPGDYTTRESRLAIFTPDGTRTLEKIVKVIGNTSIVVPLGIADGGFIIPRYNEEEDWAVLATRFDNDGNLLEVDKRVTDAWPDEVASIWPVLVTGYEGGLATVNAIRTGTMEVRLFNFGGTPPKVNRPSVTNATTAEDTLTTSGLVITPDVADTTSVKFFKITEITGGTLLKNDGVTPVLSDSFITVNEGAAGLKFMPAADANTPAGGIFSFKVQASLDATGQGLSDASEASITVSEVNDAPMAQDNNLAAIAENAAGASFTIEDLLSNDSAGPINESGQTLTLISVANPLGGEARIEGTRVYFTPTPYYAGPASFEYTVQDNGTTNGAPDLKTATAVGRFNITALPNDPPSGSVVINNGAAATSSVDVTLSITATDPQNHPMEMRLSNDGTSWGEWESHADAKDWTLSSGEGVKTVYVELRDIKGAISPSISDTIILDTNAPIVEGVRYGEVTNSDLVITFNEGTAQLNEMPFSSGDTVSTEGNHTLVVTDEAGNTTTVHFTIDKTVPVGSLLINNGEPETFSSLVNLTITGTDDGGTVEMRLSNDSTNWSDWEPVTTEKSWTLSSGYGVKTVDMELRDQAGNITPVSDTIKVVADANLSGLELTDVDLDPGFDPAIVAYTASVPHAIDEVAVTATTADPNAILRINGSDAVSRVAFPVSLNVGDNEITVEVTGQDGIPKPYTIEVHRLDLVNTLTVLTTSEEGANAGETINLHVKVSPTEGTSVPTGNVTLKEGTNTVAILSLDEQGEAVYTTSLLSIGSHTLTAEYHGDVVHRASISDAVEQRIYSVLEAYQVTARTGETVEVPILLSTSGDVAGLQFDLLFDSSLLEFKSLAQGSLMDSRIRADFHSIREGQLRVIVANLENAQIPSGTGQLMTLNFDVSPSALVDDRSELKFADPEFVDQHGNTLSADFRVKDGSVTVIDDLAPEITLTASELNATNQPVTVTAQVYGTGSAVPMKKWAKGNLAIEDFASIGVVLEGDTFEVYENGTYTVFARDAAGNVAVRSIQITNIDVESPSISVQSLTQSPNDKDASILVELNLDGTGTAIVERKASAGLLSKQEVITMGESFTDSIVITENRPYTLYVRDAAGNETVQAFFFMGDSNFDQFTDVTDWINLINFILEREVPTAAEKLVSDMNSDGLLSVMDPVVLANIIINGYTGANQTPTIEQPIEHQVVKVGEGPRTLPLAPVFRDPDGDLLHFFAQSTEETSVRVVQDALDPQLVIVPMKAGQSTVTVKATDGRGGTRTHTFTTLVESPDVVLPPPSCPAPVIGQRLDDQVLYLEGGAVRLHIQQVFEEPASVTLSVYSSDTKLVEATLEGMEVILHPKGVGVTTVSLQAENPQGKKAELSFTVTVQASPDSENLPPVVAKVIPGQQLVLEEGAVITIDLGEVFVDPNQDPLSFTVTPLDEGVGSVILEGSQLTLTPLMVGSTIMEIEANDGKGGTALTSFSVTVVP